LRLAGQSVQKVYGDGKSPHVLFRYGQAPTPLAPAEPRKACGKEVLLHNTCGLSECDRYIPSGKFFLAEKRNIGGKIRNKLELYG
jgi:hypothetical protein